MDIELYCQGLRGSGEWWDQMGRVIAVGVINFEELAQLHVVKHES